MPLKSRGREKGQQDHREELPGQDIAELLDPLKIVENPVKDEKGADPEGKTDRGEEKIPDPAVSGGPGGAPVFEGEQPGPKQRDEFIHGDPKQSHQGLENGAAS